jgi:hypothetical protein
MIYFPYVGDPKYQSIHASQYDAPCVRAWLDGKKYIKLQQEVFF